MVGHLPSKDAVQARDDETLKQSGLVFIKCSRFSENKTDIF